MRNAAADPSLLAPVKLQQAPINLGTGARTESGIDRIPVASWAMGCVAVASLAAHGFYQDLSHARRERLNDSCAGDCPDYRVDHYQESRERAEAALRLSVLAAASAVWLAYNDPEKAWHQLGQRTPRPPQQPSFRLKLKPARRGIWASMVAYF